MKSTYKIFSKKVLYNNFIFYFISSELTRDDQYTLVLQHLTISTSQQNNDILAEVVKLRKDILLLQGEGAASGGGLPEMKRKRASSFSYGLNLKP